MSIWKPWYICRPRQILIRAWRTCRYRRLLGPQSVPLPWGCSITVDPTKMIGKGIWTTGVYDIAVSEVLARLIRHGDLVLDVGANIGYMSILMGLCAGKSGELISFEPHPMLFQSLRNNLNEVQQQTCFPKTFLHNTALSDKAGEALLVIPQGFEENDGTARLGNESGQPIARLPIRTETLDGVLAGRLAAVMKLDVEGHELAVLCGATETLRYQRIQHIVYEDHQGVSSAVSSLLREQGYTILQIGFSLFGPMLASAEAPPICSPYEAPSYLATCNPEAVQQECRGRGWRVLGARLTKQWSRRPTAFARASLRLLGAAHRQR